MGIVRHFLQDFLSRFFRPVTAQVHFIWLFNIEISKRKSHPFEHSRLRCPQKEIRLVSFTKKKSTPQIHIILNAVSLWGTSLRSSIICLGRLSHSIRKRYLWRTAIEDYPKPILGHSKAVEEQDSALSKPLTPFLLLADAIFISQKNIEKRNQQLQVVGKIVVKPNLFLHTAASQGNLDKSTMHYGCLNFYLKNNQRLSKSKLNTSDNMQAIRISRVDDLSWHNRTPVLSNLGW